MVDRRKWNGGARTDAGRKPALTAEQKDRIGAKGQEWLIRALLGYTIKSRRADKIKMALAADKRRVAKGALLPTTRISLKIIKTGKIKIPADLRADVYARLIKWAKRTLGVTIMDSSIKRCLAAHRKVYRATLAKQAAADEWAARVREYELSPAGQEYLKTIDRTDSGIANRRPD